MAPLTNVHVLCSAISEDPAKSIPECNVNNAAAGGTTINDWDAGLPPRRIDLRHPDHNDVTRVSAITSHLLFRENQLIDAGHPSGLGIHYGIAEKSFAMSATLGGHDTQESLDEQVVKIEVNSICESVNDSCAADPIRLRGDGLLLSPATPCTLGTTDCMPADSYFKFVVAHEIGHVVQRRSFGAIAGSLSEASSPVDLCACDHIVTSNTLHCMQSLEGSGTAQREGFGQYFAAAAFNDPGAECRFNYYKEFVFTECIPGHELVDGCIDLNGRKVTMPPVPLSCVDQRRWRNNHCAPGMNEDRGVEFDWMNFYRNVVFGANPIFDYRALSEIYQRSCGSENVPCDTATHPIMVFENPDPGEAALTAAVSAKFGATSTQRLDFTVAGDNYGVSQKIDP